MQVSEKIGITVENKWGPEQFLLLQSQKRKGTFSKKSLIWVKEKIQVRWWKLSWEM